MSCCSKEKMERNDVVNNNRNQLSKSDREMYRVCPSKLSKRELEDLYFTLLEDNLELKKTINKQQDKIRVLSTQVQRLTSNQQKSINKEMKECCTGTKAFVNEQKDFITELKETNQRLAERIQQLNLRLSSAKQFMKGSPPQAASARPNAPFRVPSGTPKKHDCLHKVKEAPPPNSPTSALRLSTFSQWEDRSPKVSTQTEMSGPVQKSPKSDQPCDENKCRSLMEELKLKVVTLQEELGIVHTEYSTRISRLETEVSEVRKENVRVNGERSASEHELQNSVKQNSDILARCRNTEAKCAELTAELSIEKRKVAELETLLKASNMTDKINKTLEEHLTTLSEEYIRCKTCCFPDINIADNGNVTSPTGARTRFSPTKEIADIKPKQTKTADIPQYHKDSDEMALLKQNEHLLLKILELQNQMECMKKGDTESPEAKLTRLTSVDSPPLFEKLVEDQLTCVKCCYKDKPGTAESSPSKNDKAQTPRDVQTRPSPTRNKDDPKSTSTADDSGYQDSDEMGLQKMNKELLQKVLELQNQIDCLKIGVKSQKTGTPPNKMQEYVETSKKSSKPAAPIEPPSLVGELKEVTELPETKLERLTYADCNSPPSLDEISKVEKSAEQIEPTLPFPTKPSDERFHPLGKILRIEVLGSPTQSDTSQRVAKLVSSEDTRAKTVQGSNGTLVIPESLSPNTSDEFIVDYDSPTEDKTIPKLTITEKKKNEVTDTSQPDIVSNKSFTTAPRISINPEKLKYLENEGVLAKSDLERHMAQYKEIQSNGSGSITESVPSNPELGFGIPRLARKQSVTDDLPKKTQQVTVGTGPHRARNNDYFEDDILSGKLKLPMTETLADKRTAPRKTDDTKEEEDCQYCAACSFDKECELKHNLKMNKLALGMQKELCKNNDLQNVLQTPDPTPISDTKKDKKKNMFCHFIKEKTGSLTKEEQSLSQKLQATRKTGITPEEPGYVADVPLLAERGNKYINCKESLKAEKKILLKAEQKGSPNKKDTREGARWTEEGPIVFAKHTCNKGTDRVNLPDVPILAHQGKKELIEGTTGNEEAPLIEVKPPTAKVPMFSERMLPTLDGPTGDEAARVVEHAADMAQCAKDKRLEKASQAPTTSGNTDAARNKEMGEQRNVSAYRRNSGTVCLRTVQPTLEPRGCTCAGQRDGYCTSHPKSKGVQVQDNEALKIGTPRERYRQSTSERGTYTVGSNKIDAPDTDNEMSYLSDLPMENEKKSPVKSRPLSPGEDRTLTYSTTTRSDDSRTTDALSEGEMQPSTSRRYTNDAGKMYLNPRTPQPPPVQQMEAALNAISHELRHCKNLLHANRPAEVTRLSTVIL